MSTPSRPVCLWCQAMSKAKPCCLSPQAPREWSKLPWRRTKSKQAAVTQSIMSRHNFSYLHIGLLVKHHRGEPLDKNIIHSLESAVIEWSHQIRAILKKDSSEALLEGKKPTPHTELLFWKNRSASPFIQTKQPLAASENHSLSVCHNCEKNISKLSSLCFCWCL